MRAIVRVARTELLEHRRQPWMIFVLVLNHAFWALSFGLVFALFDRLAAAPVEFELFQRQLVGLGVKLETFLEVATSTCVSLSFTNLPLYVAILAANSVLHDRECGTLPFLLLSPLARWKLLTGKLLGALAIPLLLHLTFVGASSFVLGRLPLLQPWAHKFGGSPAFFVAFLVGAPASAAFVGALGTVISALSRDIRTSMQITSFFVGLLSLGIGAVLVDGLTRGVPLQVGFAAAALLASAAILLVGAKIVSREVL